MSSFALAIALIASLNDVETPPTLETPPPPPDLAVPLPPDQPAPPPPADFAQKKPDTQHLVSLTFSPLLLFLPIAEVQAEFRLGDKFGLAAVVGAGGPASFFEFEIGAQFRYYLLGSFDHGMTLGAQAMVLDFPEPGIAGFALAPMVGYKIATNLGFTFDAQVGPSFTVAGASATLTGVNVGYSNGTIGLLLNLNVGWSF